MNTHPVNPINSDGKPTNHQGKLCSTEEPPPAGFVGCPCSRYSGEGFGVHCGIGEADGFLWEIGAENASFEQFVISYHKNRSFYQDRLGTNTGKTQKEMRFPQARHTPSTFRSTQRYRTTQLPRLLHSPSPTRSPKRSLTSARFSQPTPPERTASQRASMSATKCLWVEARSKSTTTEGISRTWRRSAARFSAVSRAIQRGMCSQRQ